jgi:heme a synthase
VPIDHVRLLQAVAILGTVSAYATIVVGGTVRGMGAGLACPDWPLCHGSVVPDLADPLVAIEYTHRLAAAVTSVSLLLTFLVAVLWFRPRLGLVLLTFASLAILGTQVIVGGLTIKSSLNWVVVTIHLALGTATFATSLIVAFLSFARPPPAVPEGVVPE